MTLANGLGVFTQKGTTTMKWNGSFVNGWMAFQNLDFVTDCNGDLYLFGFTAALARPRTRH